MRIDALLDDAVQQLTDSETAQLDAEVLLAHAINKPRSYLRAYPEIEPAAKAEMAFSLLLARRLAGEPVAHLTGQREFWSLPLTISADTLIPRPETELLVEQALQRIPENAAWRITDLGTGSGAIALAIARERPDCQLLACDISPAALGIAQNNAAQLGLTNISFRHSNWCSAFADNETFNMIVSNPPYIAASDPHLSKGDVRFEPPLALVSGSDGLDAIRLIASQASHFLVNNGCLLMEHGYDQGDTVRQILERHSYRHIQTLQDYSHRDRLTVATACQT